MSDQAWDQMRLGQKAVLLAQRAQGDLAVFFTQFDFPHYDSLEKPLAWFKETCADGRAGLYISGFYINDLSRPVTQLPGPVARYNESLTMYHWTPKSLQEHQLASLCFNRQSISLLKTPLTDRLDSILPISLIAGASGKGITPAPLPPYSDQGAAQQLSEAP